MSTFYSPTVKRSLFSPGTGSEERFDTLAQLVATLPPADNDGVGAWVGSVAPFTRYQSDGVAWRAPGGGSSATRLAKIARTSQVAAFRNPRTLGVMASPPTITTGSSPAMSPTQDFEALPGGNPPIATNHPFTFSGGYPYFNPGTGGITFPSVQEGAATGGNIDNTGRAARTWRLHFMTDAALISIRLLGYQTPYRLLVDGQYVSFAPFTTANSGGSQYLHLNFGTRNPLGRKITVEGSSSAAFWAVYVPRGSSVWPIDAGDRIKVGVIGDSFSTGTGATLINDGFPVVLGDYLGADDCWSLGIGGTGYLQGQPGSYPYSGHLADWTTRTTDWDLLIFTGGNNDGGQSAAAMQAAVSSLLVASRAALPAVPFVVFGPSTAPSANNLAVETGIAAAVSALADPLIAFVATQAPANGMPEIFGSGYVGSVQGDGNADFYIGPDGAHPPTEGHAYIGRRRALQVRGAVLAMLNR